LPQRGRLGDYNRFGSDSIRTICIFQYVATSESKSVISSARQYRGRIVRVLSSLMANKQTHIKVGAMVAGACNLAWQLTKIYASDDKPENFLAALGRINLWEVAGFAAVGGVVAACLPDMLEPATSPRHRGFFHSVGCGGAVTFGAFGKHSEDWEPEHRMKVRSMALSYLSHLALDCRTPMGLPLLGLRA
jgi:membrane-bound metal-dependent hydrolase YbcI (DUF457 family)